MNHKQLIWGAALFLSLAAPLVAHADVGSEDDTRMEHLSMRIDQALNRGDIRPAQAQQLHDQVRQIRTDAHAALYDLGSLPGPIAQEIDQKIEAVNENLAVYSGRFVSYPGIHGAR